MKSRMFFFLLFFLLVSIKGQTAGIKFNTIGDTAFCSYISVGDISTVIDNKIIFFDDNCHSTNCEHLPIDKRKTFFYPDDQIVVAWVEFKNVIGSFPVVWKWYDASGNLVNIVEWRVGDGFFHKFWRIWSYSNVDIWRSFGKWKVEIYVGENKEPQTIFFYYLDKRCF